MQKIVLLKKSSVKDKKPTLHSDSNESGLRYGELAINYNSESLNIYTRNNKNEIVSIVEDSSFNNYYTGVNEINANTNPNNILIDPSKKLNIIYINEVVDTINLTIDGDKKRFGEVVCIINNKSSAPVTINYDNITTLNHDNINKTVNNGSLYNFTIVYDGTYNYIIK